MEASVARRICESMREPYNARMRTLNECRHYGFQMRLIGDSYSQGDKNATLAPLQSSTPASLAWRTAMFLHANTVGIGSTFFSTDCEVNGDDIISETDKKDVAGLSHVMMRALFDTNFSSEVLSCFGDYTVLGTMCCMAEWNNEEGRIEFKQYQIGDGCYFGENSKGFPNQFCRFFKYNATQAFDAYGDKAGKDVLDAIKNKEQNLEFDYVWLVYPRKLYGEEVKNGNTVPSKKKAWGSVVVDLRNDAVVAEGGYDDFPFAICRWGTRGGNPYGWSPLEMSLPDMKYLAELKFLKKKAVKKQISPPLVANALWEGISTEAGAVTFVEAPDLSNGFVAIPTPVNLPMLENDVKECIFNIRQNLLLDSFEALDAEKRYMTRGEAEARVGQSVRAIAPIVSRIHREFFSPLLNRVLNILVSKGVVSIPEAVSREKVRIKYVSVLDSLVLQGESSKLQQFFSQFLLLAQSKRGIGPEFDCYFDMSEVIKSFGGYFNIPPKIIRESKLAREMLEQLTAQMQDAQQQQLEASQIKPLDLQRSAEYGSPMRSGAF